MCQVTGVRCQVSPVTCHKSLTPTATAMDPPPANSPTMHSRILLHIYTHTYKKMPPKTKSYVSKQIPLFVHVKSVVFSYKFCLSSMQSSEEEDILILIGIFVRA